ncbi:MAG TPA: hypothetical protein VFD55_03050 [Candidatus Angelobacter sp.]|nr:hypothetical protein [Candidatus Angelobacter sp.]
MFKKIKEQLGFFENWSKKQSYDCDLGNGSNIAEVGEISKGNNYSYPKNKPAKKIRTMSERDDEDEYYLKEIEKAEKISIRAVCVVVLCIIFASAVLACVSWLLLKLIYRLPINIF